MSLKIDKLDLQEKIFIDFLNIIDDQTLFEIIRNSTYYLWHIRKPSRKIELQLIKEYGHTIQYIKNPSESMQLAAINKNLGAITHIKNPKESVQLAVVQEIDNDNENFAMTYYYEKITSGLALNLLYNKVSDYYKEIIRINPNYKTDAQVILEKINL